jgi:hypothetical protein
MKMEARNPFESLMFLLTLALGLLCAPRQAYAQTGTLNWHWSYDNTRYVVGPTDEIVINATLFNETSSTITITPNFIGGTVFTGPLQSKYDFQVPPEWGIQFSHISLHPGESFPFVWGRLFPIGGYVSPGSYVSDFALFGVGFGSVGGSKQPQNSFTVQVVPEPCALVLLLAAGVYAARQLETKSRAATQRKLRGL